MTKRHFIALADAIRYDRPAFSNEAIAALAKFCRSQNARFNHERWTDYINGDCTANGKFTEMDAVHPTP